METFGSSSLGKRSPGTSQPMSTKVPQSWRRSTTPQFMCLVRSIPCESGEVRFLQGISPNFWRSWRLNVHTIKKRSVSRKESQVNSQQPAIFGAFVWRPSICPQCTQTLARNGSTMGGGYEQPIEGRLLLNVDLQPEDKWNTVTRSWIVLDGLTWLKKQLLQLVFPHPLSP